jgi:hypothetical protein
MSRGPCKLTGQGSTESSMEGYFGMWRQPGLSRGTFCFEVQIMRGGRAQGLTVISMLDDCEVFAKPNII